MIINDNPTQRVILKLYEYKHVVRGAENNIEYLLSLRNAWLGHCGRKLVYYVLNIIHVKLNLFVCL